MTGPLPWWKGWLYQWLAGARPRCPARLTGGAYTEFFGRCELEYGHVTDAFTEVQAHALERGAVNVRWSGDGRQPVPLRMEPTL